MNGSIRLCLVTTHAELGGKSRNYRFAWCFTSWGRGKRIYLTVFTWATAAECCWFLCCGLIVLSVFISLKFRVLIWGLERKKLISAADECEVLIVCVHNNPHFSALRCESWMWFYASHTHTHTFPPTPEKKSVWLWRRSRNQMFLSVLSLGDALVVLLADGEAQWLTVIGYCVPDCLIAFMEGKRAGRCCRNAISRRITLRWFVKKDG